MELNKVHHLDWLENGLPDKSVQLIIADPPYFEIKGEFDFIWSSFDEYLKDVEEWARISHTRRLFSIDTLNC
jgi:DNA modification methylase